jgi:hypothetical protein
VGLDLIHDA